MSNHCNCNDWGCDICAAVEVEVPTISTVITVKKNDKSNIYNAFDEENTSISDMISTTSSKTNRNNKKTGVVAKSVDSDGFVVFERKEKKMSDKVCYCRVCHMQFIFSIKQQIKYKSLKWKEPKTCFECKNVQ
jgi:hypothetical protein